MLLKRTQSYTRLVLAGTGVFSRPAWRDELREQLTARAFKEVDASTDPIREGFVDPWHLSTVTFEDSTRLFFEPHIVLGYRVDRRSVPANLYNAELQRRIAAWCAEHEVERCPNAVRQQLKDDLKQEWMLRALPKVKHLQISIDMTNGVVRMFGSSAEADVDLIRRALSRVLGEKVYLRGSNPDEGNAPGFALLSRAVTLGPIRPLEAS